MNKKLFPSARKDLVFISIVLIALIVMIVFDTDVDILVNYDEEMLQVTSPRLNIDVEHAHVSSIELVPMPSDFGEKIGDSYAHEAYCAGTWENDTWGTYTLCVIPGNSQCIVVHMDFTTVVFSCTTDEKTQVLFDSYSAYLGSLAA